MMMSTVEFLSRGAGSRRPAHGPARFSLAHWSHTPRIVARAPDSAGANARRVVKHLGGAADQIAVQAMRLAVLAVLVWGGSALVRNVTAALQEVAGHSPAVRIQAAPIR
jgi:hypothetical protein